MHKWIKRVVIKGSSERIHKLLEALNRQYQVVERINPSNDIMRRGGLWLSVDPSDARPQCSIDESLRRLFNAERERGLKTVSYWSWRDGEIVVNDRAYFSARSSPVDARVGRAYLNLPAQIVCASDRRI